MQHQQRLAQSGEAIGELLLGDVVQKLLADAERPARERDLHLALLLDVVHVLPEQAGDVRRIGRRRDGGDRARLGNLLRGDEHRGAAEAVTDQDRGRLILLPQMIGRRHQVGDVRRERRVGELALARAEAGEIEAQHRDAARGQALRRCALPPARPCRR